MFVGTSHIKGRTAILLRENPEQKDRSFLVVFWWSEDYDLTREKSKSLQWFRSVSDTSEHYDNGTRKKFAMILGFSDYQKTTRFIRTRIRCWLGKGCKVFRTGKNLRSSD